MVSIKSTWKERDMFCSCRNEPLKMGDKQIEEMQRKQQFLKNPNLQNMLFILNKDYDNMNQT